MNILSVAPAYYPATRWGGPIFFDYGLNNTLAGMTGVEIKVLTTDVASPKSSERLDVNSIDHSDYINQEVIFTKRVAGESVSFDLLRKLPLLIRWADVVRLSATYSFPTFPVLILCRLYSKPLVWTLHGAVLDTHVWPGAPRRRLKRLWEMICSRLVKKDRTMIHALSELEMRSAEVRIPGVRTAVVPNGLSIYEIDHNKQFLPDGSMRLIYLGRLSPKKGVENLLSAMFLLREYPISLKIYGSGDLGYVDILQGLVEKFDLGDTVNFMGEVTGIDKDAAFYNADVCIVPSHTESFCIVVAEALNHGVPVIASHGTPWQNLEAEQCGLWVDNKPDSLAHAIKEIRSMPLSDMGRRGWEWMSRDYSWDAVASKMMNLYRSIES